MILIIRKMALPVTRTLNNKTYKTLNYGILKNRNLFATRSTILIARDIDLLNLNKNCVDQIEIIKTEKLTSNNFKNLIAFKSDKFAHAVSNYGCDVCNIRCSPENPVYTNNLYQGIDICSKCIKTSSKTIDKLVDFYPGSVYSLRDIYDAVKYSE